MIRFWTNVWWSSLCVWYGGVVPRLVVPTIAYCFYCAALYKAEVDTRVAFWAFRHEASSSRGQHPCQLQVCYEKNFLLSEDGIKLVAGCTTFMLVFRLNQCYSRLVVGQGLVVDALSSLRAVVFCVCAFVSHSPKRGQWSEAERQAALMLKVHVCRLTIAFAVSLKYHLRIGDMMLLNKISGDAARHALSDLVRLKGLLTEKEAELVDAVCGLYEEDDPGWGCGAATRVCVDFNRFRLGRAAGRRSVFESDDHDDHGGAAVPVLILQLLRGILMEPVGKTWGFPERFLNMNEANLGNALRAFEGMTNLVTTPLPLPYLQLGKLLLLVFVFTYPLSIHLQNGIWGNVIVPTVLSMALLGLENVADFMENPFGDDSADISLYEFIHALEVEVQNAFNLSEQHHEGLLESWQALGRHFELDEGVALLQHSNVQERCHRFTNFFEWTPLPAHTVHYIKQQSSEVTSYHTNLVASTCGTPEDLAGQSESEVLMQTETDVFSIRLCVSLRGPERQVESFRRHRKALEEFGSCKDMSLGSVRASMRKDIESSNDDDDWSESQQSVHFTLGPSSSQQTSSLRPSLQQQV